LNKIHPNGGGGRKGRNSRKGNEDLQHPESGKKKGKGANASWAGLENETYESPFVGTSIQRRAVGRKERRTLREEERRGSRQKGAGGCGLSPSNSIKSRYRDRKAGEGLRGIVKKGSRVGND